MKLLLRLELVMKPTIQILESGKILLDRLNANKDFVEIDTKDMVFLQLI